MIKFHFAIHYNFLMKKFSSITSLEKWIDSYLNFEKTPKKNIFWLETMRFFCEKFGHPENFAPCFHVAGSKGKGSVSLFIASILDAAGYKTGLYTSPHILDFIERVSSATGPFDESVYARAVEEIMTGVKSIDTKELPSERPITWFELVTLFGFLVFRQAKVDYSVFEVGLGGRLDSTNVVTPICSCIAALELEHTEFLGDTIEKIAAEKGGIIKSGVPVVVAKQTENVKEVLRKIAKEKNSKVIFVDEIIKDIKTCLKKYTIKDVNLLEKDTYCMDFELSCGLFSRTLKAKLNLLGNFQAENAALAAIAIKTALPQISEETIEKGLSNAKLPARFEICENPKGFEGIPALILDGAHTVKSVGFTMETFNTLFEDKDAALLFGCAADKDSKDIAPLFKNAFSKVYLTRPGEVKQSNLSEIESCFSEAGIKYDSNSDFKMQIKKALEESAENKRVLLVTGSFYLVSEVKKILKR
ncbi:bifunctional folylpolyglutamate synthase/dihydrofolate synthase [Treponema zioleckii]|uniref:bifunctional folylpolyglutamate synthase/dihydrofolate synthase n=1 Tax=Treponema zioleckii TaxID=331680 RepID=UPI001F5B8D84|nr:folylpolyglutamate synthase/dihydrofolate synthase family protein [Treponema zioleckii]